VTFPSGNIQEKLSDEKGGPLGKDWCKASLWIDGGVYYAVMEGTATKPWNILLLQPVSS
jgi:hypothetical protein